MSLSIIPEKHKLWDSSLFSKFWKLNVDFRISVKHWEKIFCFLDNSIWVRCCKFYLLPAKYSWSGVNVLTNGLKISYVTKKVFFELKYCQSDEQRWQNYYCVYYSSVWDLLNMLTVLECPEIWLFRHFHKRIFCSL